MCAGSRYNSRYSDGTRVSVSAELIFLRSKAISQLNIAKPDFMEGLLGYPNVSYGVARNVPERARTSAGTLRKVKRYSAKVDVIENHVSPVSVWRTQKSFDIRTRRVQRHDPAPILRGN
jgi:hypothetical protein